MWPFQFDIKYLKFSASRIVCFSLNYSKPLQKSPEKLPPEIGIAGSPAQTFRQRKSGAGIAAKKDQV